MGGSVSIAEVHYVMRKNEYPDQTLTLTGTDAVTLTKPVTVPYGPVINLFGVSPELVRHLDALDTEFYFDLEITPVFPYKFELNILDFDDSAVDSWDDGIPRIRGGTLSLLSNSTFVSLFTISHEQQLERAVETFNAIFAPMVETNWGYTFGPQILNNEAHFAELIGTALAHRLTKTVILQVIVWWLYRVTIYQQSVSP